MLKMHLIIEVLRMICAVYGIVSVVQTIDNYPLYGHLLPVKTEKIRKNFQVTDPLLLKPIVYQVVNEHISNHMVICE